MFTIEEKKKALVEYLLNEGELNEDEVEGLDIDVLDEDGLIQVGNQEFWVLDDVEAHDKAVEYTLSLIDDMGIESFTESFQSWILDNAVKSEWFKEALYENYESYADDIASEGSSSDEFENRLEEEMADAGVDNEEDFIEYLVENAGDPVQYFRNEFGNEEFNRTAIEHDLIDWDAVAEEAVSTDGPANSLASYDGKERDLGNGLLAYRAN